MLTLPARSTTRVAISRRKLVPHVISDPDLRCREPAAANGEQIATGVFHIEYDFDLPGWYFQFVDTESEEGGMRFDGAWLGSPSERRRWGRSCRMPRVVGTLPGGRCLA
ncbi:hypothetical protein [Micromonospora arida]|uniref:hypothetical protein n=1 Tax=Micromonospora arida TaxID=2203715 RepID=UPI0033B02869